MTNIEVESIVGSTDLKPIVQLTVGERVEQMRPSKAREIGVMLFECAVEAERDAATIAGVKGMGLDDASAGRMLQMIRVHREEFTGL